MGQFKGCRYFISVFNCKSTYRKYLVFEAAN